MGGPTYLSYLHQLVSLVRGSLGTAHACRKMLHVDAFPHPPPPPIAPAAVLEPLSHVSTPLVWPPRPSPTPPPRHPISSSATLPSWRSLPASPTAPGLLSPPTSSPPLGGDFGLSTGALIAVACAGVVVFVMFVVAAICLHAAIWPRM